MYLKNDAIHLVSFVAMLIMAGIALRAFEYHYADQENTMGSIAKGLSFIY